MIDLASLSKDALIELVTQRDEEVRHRDQQLRDRDQQLRQQNEELRRQDIELQEQRLKIEKLKQENQEWELAYNKLLQQTFGRRSERYLEDPNQLRLDFGNTPEAADAAEGLAAAIEDQRQTVAEHQRRRPRRQRDEGLPEHLPRYEVIAEVPDDPSGCPKSSHNVSSGREMRHYQGILQRARKDLPDARRADIAARVDVG